VPLVTGVSQLSTDRAVEFARDAERIGVNAPMVLPAMVYVPTADPLYIHFKMVAEATSLPIMLYNNPPAYRVSIELGTLEQLATISNLVAVKESAPDPRRFTDIINAFGDRYTLLAGLDDVALEALLLGASGWVSGLTSAFPRESVALMRAAERGDWVEAWCNQSSWRSRSWVAARSECACRAWFSPARGV
jgi:1-pyrroline-4-hydroxy-2-carboxylate deaminase